MPRSPAATRFPADGVFDGAQDSYGGGGEAALGMPMRV
jgi:hypothetical protein